MDEAKKRALAVASERYEAAKRRARVAAIEAEDAWSEMVRLSDDNIDLDAALEALMEQRRAG